MNLKKVTYLVLVYCSGISLTACSTGDSSTLNTEELATVGFEVMAAENGTCKAVEASYVEIVLTKGTEVIVGEEQAYKMPLVKGHLITDENSALALAEGVYNLEHFAVYNEDDELIWVAPKEQEMKNSKKSALPMEIILKAGEQRNINVPIRCKDDDSDLGEYQVLRAVPVKALKYCFYADYCLPSGKLSPARYSVEFSVEGEVIYKAEQNINEVGTNEFGDFYAKPLCFALPNLARYTDDEAYLDYTVRLLDWEGVYETEEGGIITGSLSRNDIYSNYDGDQNLFYKHLKFGCEQEKSIVE